jgi:hypothetical protein
MAGEQAVSEQIEVWGRRFMWPHINLVRPAQPHPFATWNRYGGIPGTPNHGVTIGFALMWRGRGVGVRWARPTVYRVEAS